MRVGKLFLVLSLVLFSAGSFAYETGKWTKVTQIYAKNDGTIYVWFGSGSMPGCFANRSAFLRGSDVEKLYSTILAAQISGKSVLPLYQYWNAQNGSTGWDMCYIEAIYFK